MSLVEHTNPFQGPPIAAPYSDKSARSQSAIVNRQSSMHAPGAVLITGAANSGKSIFAAELARVTGWKYVELSELIRSRAADVYSRIIDGQSYCTWSARMSNDKARYREFLRAFADSHRDAVGDYWIAKALAMPFDVRIVCGVRRLCEVKARLARGFDDLWIKIERPGWVSPPDSSYELQDIEQLTNRVVTVVNTGVDRLREQARRLYECGEMLAQRR